MTPDVQADPPPQRGGEGSALPQTVEQQLAPVLEGIPEPKRTEIVHSIEQQLDLDVDFLKDRYGFELDRRDRLTAAIALPSGITTAFGRL